MWADVNPSHHRLLYQGGKNMWHLLVAALILTITSSAIADDSIAAPKIDLRPEFEKYKLDVRQQGKRGACQVFAMVGVIEFQLARQGKQADLSEQFLMWAANKANNLKLKEGFNPDYLIAGLMQYGICEESLMLYVPKNEIIRKPSEEAIKDAQTRTSCKVISIKHWSSSIGYGEKDMKEILRRLEKGSPVSGTFCWPEGLYDEQIVNKQHFIIDKSIDGKSKDGHGVILVGYGVDEKIAGGGYFIIRNSWGTKFADRGYAKITFEYAKKYGIDAYIVSVR
jgi:C1A family cysteine protease